MNRLRKGALSGVRITDLTWAWAGPFATTLLTYLGAEVIRVESQKRPDHTRTRSITTGQLFGGLDNSPIFNYMNQNKFGVSLNLSHPDSVNLVKRLVSISDVIAENMRPGSVDRMGLGYPVLQKINPSIIMLSSSARGGTGPEKTYTGYAPTFGALGGAAYLTGYTNEGPARLLGEVDLISGTAAALAVLAGLNHRARTGQGQLIDLSSSDVISSLLGEAFMDYSMNKRVQTRQGNRDDIMAPHNCYACQGKDNWVSIAVATDEEWQALCQAIGQPELAKEERFATGFKRWHNQSELDKIISQWTRGKERYQVMDLLQSSGVAAVPVFNCEDVYKDPHLNARDFWHQVEHPLLGKQLMIAPPWKLSATPAQSHKGAPLMGEHNKFILGELLGLSHAEIQRLIEEKAIY
jgi:benzylsuccinate CoA-transferase BbsF subunit